MTTASYLTEATTDHGLRVAVRPLQASDRADLAAGFQLLSEESRFRRFMSSKPRVRGAEIQRLYDDRHICMVLVWPRTSCPDIVLGLAEAIALPDQPGVSEFSIVIADEIQGQGAGRLLTGQLAAQARAAGVQELVGYMLGTNAAPARLLAGLGEVVHDRVHAGEREMRVRLTGGLRPGV